MFRSQSATFKSALSAALVAGIFLLPVHAQIRSASGGIRAGGRLITNRLNSQGARRRYPERNGAGRGYSPLLWGEPYFYDDDDGGALAAATDNPVQVVMVAAPAGASTVAKEVPAEPLLIEWQGDHYARVGEPDGEKAKSTSAHGMTAKSGGSRQQPDLSRETSSAELLPVELVYRDGHREQVRQYTIANGVLYANGNYWTDGYWTKNIQLRTLDLPATALASQERGVRFRLPSSATEVITRP